MLGGFAVLVAAFAASWVLTGEYTTEQTAERSFVINEDFTKIRKIVSGDTPETLEKVAALYASVVTAGVYKASSIKVAEAAKVIENTQRDLNIAFVNELAIVFDKLGIDTHEVLQAAGTKWNFLNFRPGLVGGHCIGVDPYYLTHRAERAGYEAIVLTVDTFLPGWKPRDLRVAWQPQLEGIGGRYFEDNHEAEKLTPEAVGSAPGGVAPYALDPDAAERLWELSLATVRA